MPMPKFDILLENKFPYTKPISVLPKTIIPNTNLNKSTSLYLALTQARCQVSKLSVPPSLLIDKFLQLTINFNFENVYPPTSYRDLKKFLYKLDEVIYKPAEKYVIECIFYYISKDFDVVYEPMLDKSMIHFLNVLYYFDRFQVCSALKWVENVDDLMTLPIFVNHIIQIIQFIKSDKHWSFKREKQEQEQAQLQTTTINDNDNTKINNIIQTIKLNSNLMYSSNILNFCISVNIPITSITNPKSIEIYYLSLSDYDPMVCLKIMYTNYHQNKELLYTILKRILERINTETDIIKEMVLTHAQKLKIYDSLPIMCLINISEDFSYNKLVSGLLYKIMNNEKALRELSELILSVRNFKKIYKFKYLL